MFLYVLYEWYVVGFYHASFKQLPTCAMSQFDNRHTGHCYDCTKPFRIPLLVATNPAKDILRKSVDPPPSHPLLRQHRRLKWSYITSAESRCWHASWYPWCQWIWEFILKKFITCYECIPLQLFRSAVWTGYPGWRQYISTNPNLEHEFLWSFFE